jgi:hypothetical protein
MKSIFTILLLITIAGIGHGQYKTNVLDSLSRYAMQYSLKFFGRVSPMASTINPGAIYLLTGIEKSGYLSGNNSYETIYSGRFTYNSQQLKIAFYDSTQLSIEEDVSIITDTFSNADLLDRVKPHNLNSELLRVNDGRFHGSYFENERKISLQNSWITVRKAKGRVITPSGPRYSRQYTYALNCPALERNISGSLHDGNWTDSVVTETIDCNTQIVTGIFLDTYTYNNQGKLTKRTYENWSNGNWVMAYQSIYEYNEYGAETENIVLEYNNRQLVNSSRRQLITDNNGFELEFKYKGNGSSWNMYYKTFLSLDSTLGEKKYCEYIKQENQGQWVNIFRYRILFDNSLPLLAYMDQWDKASQKWNLFSITKRQYLALDDEIYVVKEESYSDGFGTQIKLDLDEQNKVKKSYLGTCLTLEDFENGNFHIEKIITMNTNYQDTMDIWTSEIWDGSAYTKYDSIVNIYDNHGNIKLMTYEQYYSNEVSFGEKYTYLYTLRQPAEIENIPYNDRITLYPNPVKSIVYYKNATDFNYLEVYDFNGRLILSRELHSGSGKIFLHGLSPGFYLFRFINGGKDVVYRMVKS